MIMNRNNFSILFKEIQHVDGWIFIFQKYDKRNKCDTDTPVSFIDVYQEFNDKVAEQHKIMKFKSMVSYWF